MEVNRDTQLCISLAAFPGNFGNRFHNFLFRELGLNFIYKSLTTQNLEDSLRGIRALGIRGTALSMPFKEPAAEFLRKEGRLDPAAYVARAAAHARQPAK